MSYEYGVRRLIGLASSAGLDFFEKIGYYLSMKTDSSQEKHFVFPNPKTLIQAERRVQRFLEMIPGLLSWGTLFGMFFISFLLPVWAAVAIILFDLYWLYRIFFISLYSTRAHFRLVRGKRMDWWARCQWTLSPLEFSNELTARISQLAAAMREIPWFSLSSRLSVRMEISRTKDMLAEVKRLIPLSDQFVDWRKIIHVILLPTAGEPADIIEPAIQSLADSHFPKEQMIVLLATEEREDAAHRAEKVEYLKKKFDGIFRDFLVTTHVVADGEMKCKASNAKFAAKELQKYLDDRHIDYTRVIFSNFDCDSVAHPEYFSALTYAYVTNPKRLQRAYQPIPVYHNNIWDTNALVRLVVTGSSFWHLFQSTRREMVTFSSHSEPFDTLVRVGFWPVNMISEDSVIYWKCISYFHGDYEVHPIHLPVSLDAVLAETWWKTIKNQYKQKRRWAYGIENFPVTMRAIWPDKKISLWKKLKISFEMLEGHYSWATTSFILAFLGWLPLLLGGVAFRESVLAHNLPIITERLMTFAMLGMVISVPLSIFSLPPKPERYHWTRYFVMLFQWVLSPFVAFLSAFPALDSQTRLLFGKYFGEFWVTEKMRKK